ncbi:MAG: putative cell wall binding repeat 2-containing protein [Firmicutes bacterium]|nr:putative cell wall binding repeat 2-containing protein [Bacillota bacterium]
MLLRLFGRAEDLTLTYTAAGPVTDGTLTLEVDGALPAPTTAPGVGRVTASAGTVATAGHNITVSGITLPDGDGMNIIYRGVTVPGTPGNCAFTIQEQSTAGGTLMTLPDRSVYAQDGSGTLTVLPGGFAPRQTGVGLTFTYTAPAGGLWLGELAVTVPAGWTPPSVTESAILCCATLPIPDPGSVTASAGTVSVSGQTITVAGVTLDRGQTVMITYSNVTVGGIRGSFRFAAQQKSTRFGTLKPLAASPSVTVGSATAPGAPARGQQGRAPRN